MNDTTKTRIETAEDAIDAARKVLYDVQGSADLSAGQDAEVKRIREALFELSVSLERMTR